jgi:hypothetical protein
MQRRTLLRVGVATGALLALAGGGLALIEPARKEGRFTEPARQFYAAVARAVLGTWLPFEAAARAQALSAQVQRIEDAIAGMPPAVQAEVDELSMIGASAPGRIALLGMSKRWPEASDAELVAMMQSLRDSSLALRQQVFQALRELTLAAWLAEPRHWAAVGYAGQLPVPNLPEPS